MFSWQRFFQVALDLHCVTNLEGAFRWVSPSFTTVLGWSEDELLDQPYLAFVHPDDKESTRETATFLREGGEVLDFENRYRTADGGYRWLQWRVSPAPDEGVAYATARDVTERRRLAAELEGRRAELADLAQQSRAQYQGVLEHAPVGILVTNLEGRILDANREIAEMMGYDAPDAFRGGESAATGLYAEAGARQKLLEKLQADGRVQGYEVRFRSRRRDPFWVRIDGVLAPPGRHGESELMAFVSDITEERELRGQLLQGQKMEAIGTLAGGVAHDFNNLLTVILSDAEMLRDELDGTPHDLAEEIRDAALHARAVTGKLLAFSRKGPTAREATAVSEVVAETEGLVSRLLQEDVVLEVELDEELAPVLFDRNQLQQVILNLVVNAQDAMPDGGRITLRTRVTRLSEADARSRVEADAGEYVVLEVADTGTGIDQETLNRIFEPYFTTKAEDQGTGLGLSTVRGIVTDAGGHVTVDTERGKGTTFGIHLPTSAPGDDSVPRPIPPRTRTKPAGGSETILVVEDDDAVRSTIVRLLERLGYEVFPARGSEEALEIWRDAADQVALVVVDVGLPDVRGPELVGRMENDRPDLRALHVSGFSGDEVVERGELDEDARFLTKPFAPDELARAVRRALDGSATDRRAGRKTNRE